MKRPRRLTGTPVIATALLMVALILSSASSTNAATGQGGCSPQQEPIELCSSTTLTASSARAMRVRLPEPQTIRDGSVGPGQMIEITGGGPFTQFLLLADVPQHADYGLEVTWFPVAHPRIRGTANLYHPDPKLWEACTPSSTGCVLPAGTYIAYLLPMEGSASVTLRFEGLPKGALDLVPDMAVDYQARSLTPRFDPDPRPMYAAGDSGTLSGLGFLGVVTHVRSDTTVMLESMGCLYVEEPPAYLPGCPGHDQAAAGQFFFIIVDDPTGPRRSYAATGHTQFHGRKAGTFSLGASLTSAGTLDDVFALGYWLTFLL